MRLFLPLSSLSVVIMWIDLPIILPFNLLSRTFDTNFYAGLGSVRRSLLTECGAMYRAWYVSTTYVCM